MLSKEEYVAKGVEDVMIDVYTRLGIEFKTYVTMINYEGAKVVSEK